ncbi:hypothetical protein SAMN05660463_02030 [Pseudomonas sp. URIL14HWK12:I9]|nr:hypothetical protein F474_02562 [Pseudomonas sp. URIL14HWK12:I12]PVZ23787.1 hypothetical protein F470_02217 [Pseudomonas sp. URIL14HWK12:I10]PVZ33574.1 hypothetical protein F472_03045 [Pseudomonas sp. URIL14HWK12:I11]SNZ12064.1 hypothetical protein SAMN05660463_02030 [Pseudomonas sp. URIL14HWK12:I9]
MKTDLALAGSGWGRQLNPPPCLLTLSTQQLGFFSHVIIIGQALTIKRLH